MRGGYVGESKIAVGIFPGGVSEIPESGERNEGGHAGRVLLQHGLPQEVCNPAVERAATGEESAAAAAARGEL